MSVYLSKLIEEINRTDLREYVELKKSKGTNNFVCPICGSGTKKHRTGALHYHRDTNRWRCYADADCFSAKGQDTLGALRCIYGGGVHSMQGFYKTIERATGYRRCDIIDDVYGSELNQSIEHVNKKKRDLSDTYIKWHKALKQSPKALSYLTENRGITEESIDKYQIGYCEIWRHSKAPEYITGKPYVIIPRTKRTYVARSVDGNGAYTKLVDGTQSDFFNVQAIKTSSVIYVVEGELDAISIMQLSDKFQTVAIGSTSNTESFADTVKKENPNAVYVLMLDNDKMGRKAQKQLEQQLHKRNIKVIADDPATIYGNVKDANEFYCSEGSERFILILNKMKSKVEEGKEYMI